MKELCWQSDWDGEEVGYPDIPVVGYYTKGNMNYYINTENGVVLEEWEDDEDEDFGQD